MELSLKIEMNAKLFLRNPEESQLGRNIVKHAIILIHKIGFEAFTFKKLAKEVNTTEAGIYRYFENKHRLLLYIVDWYWSWQEYRLVFHANNISDPRAKLKKAIELLSTPVEEDASAAHINEKLLYNIVMMEGAKSYLTRHVIEDNKNKLFKPYKDLCGRIADIIIECNPDYKFPRSMASTILEMAHSQNYYLKNLPSLTDFAESKDASQIGTFLEDMAFTSIKK